jgi:2-acylglycerol O-acyltransferase 2
VLGADIVPVYSLGQSRMLDFRGCCGLSRRLRTAVGVFWGRWGLPVPRRHDIIVAVGRPIPGTACSNCTGRKASTYETCWGR